jgi:TolB protein
MFRQCPAAGDRGVDGHKSLQRIDHMRQLTMGLAIAMAAGCGSGPPAAGDAATDGTAGGASAVAPAAGAEVAGVADWPGAVPYPDSPSEPRLTNLRKLTHGGQNAEAYFSADATRLIFQATIPGESECDQIYTMDVEGRHIRRVSTGLGRTTCGYFFPTQDRILFSSTHHVNEACPPPPDRSRGYVWPLHPYDIFLARPDGSELRRLTDNPGYDAEATVSPDGRNIVFTSDRDGDLDIYVMDADGGNVRRLTHEEGYDGGAFFSHDGSRIVYRAYHPTDPAELEEYRELLRDGLVRPGRVEIFVMDADGSNKRQLTNNGAANFAPFFHPEGRRIIYSSNVHDPSGRGFNLYMIDVASGEIERVTDNPGFDSFPMFSSDGRRLIFSSSRDAEAPGRFDIYIAEWVEDPA